MPIQNFARLQFKFLIALSIMVGACDLTLAQSQESTTGQSVLEDRSDGAAPQPDDSGQVIQQTYSAQQFEPPKVTSFSDSPASQQPGAFGRQGLIQPANPMRQNGNFGGAQQRPYSDSVGDGSQAKGTFATENPSAQDMLQERRRSTPLVPQVKQFGDLPSARSQSNRRSDLQQQYDGPSSTAMPPITNQPASVASLPIQDPATTRPATTFGNSNAIRPAGFAEPIVPKKKTTDLANALMSRYSVDNIQGALPGEPMKLIDFIQQQPDVNIRKRLVHDYWEAYYDWAMLLNSQQYLQWIQQAGRGRTQAETTMLRAATLQAENRVRAKEINLQKSQASLLQYIPNRPSELLPLPSDQPLIKRYRTNYKVYQSYRLLPESLRGIDQVLPKKLQLITSQAEVVQMAKSAAEQAIAELGGGQTTVATVLEAGRLWRTCEEDFVNTVTNYNQAIADYALNVTSGAQSPEKTVAMLIGKPKTKSIDSIAQSPNNQGVRTAQNPSILSNSQPITSGMQIGSRPTAGNPASQFNQQGYAGVANRNNTQPPGNGRNNFGPTGVSGSRNGFGGAGQNIGTQGRSQTPYGSSNPAGGNTNQSFNFGR